MHIRVDHVDLPEQAILPEISALVLNLELVRASPSLIDHVIAHELAHALHPNHGAGWEELLTRVMPDWLARKDELERELL